MSLSKAMGCERFDQSDTRPDDDFYPTPPDCTDALLVHPFIAGCLAGFHGKIKEPACGDGAIAKRIIAAGHKVNASNLTDRGYGRVGADYLVSTGNGGVVITNPPFDTEMGSAVDFLVHAQLRKVDLLCLLLKSNFFHPSSRTTLFWESRPRFKFDLTWRPDFTGGGSPTMEMSWFIWIRRWRGPCITEPLPKAPGPMFVHKYGRTV